MFDNGKGRGVLGCDGNGRRRRGERLHASMVAKIQALWPVSAREALSKIHVHDFLLAIFSRLQLIGDFGTAADAVPTCIFFLTSIFIDSIQSTSCNNAPLQIFHEEWKGE